MGKEKSTGAEDRALADALLAYSQNAGPDNTAPLKDFLTSHPQSVWRVSLLTNLGLIERQGGYWSEALASWQEAWELGKDEKESTRRLIVDRALAQLAELTARLGRIDDLEALFAEAGQRKLRGVAAQKWIEAHESLTLMKTAANRSFRCGPLAVGRIYATLHPKEASPPAIHQSQCTDHGTSLEQVRAFAEKVGLNYQMAFRAPGAAVMVPSVVNWKVGHFAALTKSVHGKFVVQDPTFTDNFVVSQKALDQEASGYFLVPSGALPDGWRTVSADEGGKVWGKGAVSTTQKPAPPGVSPHIKGPCGNGMAAYNVDPSSVNLTMADIPFAYAPPRGPTISFMPSYSQRDSSSSSIPPYAYLGPQWSFNWVCFVVDDPANATTSTYGPGGGSLTYTGYTETTDSTGSFAPQALDRDVLERTSASTYIRHYPDGSQEIFALSNGASPALIFLTEYDDPTGQNKILFGYDGNFRLTTVTDAMGQATNISYVSDDPTTTNGDLYRVAQVQDTFGRAASLAYNANGQLSQITDTAGLTSQFSYTDGTDLINTLTTPYGNTTFVSTDDATTMVRSLTITDPEGAQEYLELNLSPASAPPPPPPDAGAPVPSAPGLLTDTTYQQFRTTYYWDKKAYADASGDRSKAHLMQWLHMADDGDSMSNILESEKKAYESRVYYTYLNQTSPFTATDDGNVLIRAARVLDDGSTQCYQCDYNTKGKITRMVTPGDGTTPSRTTTFTYANNGPAYAQNGIDLIAVYQENPAGQSTDSYSVAADLLSSYGYDAGGQHLILSATDAAGQTSNFTYNSYGQMLTATNALSQQTTLAYDHDDGGGVTDGYLLSVTGPEAEAEAQLQYDGFKRLWKITDVDGDTTTLEYDAIGGDATKTLNRPAKSTYPDGTTEQTLYYLLDPQWHQDRAGRWTELFYDKLRHLAAVLDPLGRLTQYEWCTCGALEAIIDPAGRQTSWVRDEQSRVVNKIYPDDSVVTYTYENTTSRLKSVLDAKGQQANYLYYIDNSLKQLSWTDAGGAALSPPTPGASYTYDASYLRVLTMTDGIGTTTNAYSPITSPAVLGAGRLLTVDGPWANDTISYTYDELGRVATRSIDGANNYSEFHYDDLGRLHTTTNALGLFTYNYVGVTGRMDNVAYPNEQTIQYGYFDASGSRRLQEIKNLDAASTPVAISQFDYTYNAVGDVLTWTQNNSGLTHARQYAFGFDAADQLIAASSTDTVTLRQQAYRYDSTGNRVTTQDGNTLATETPNNLNQLTQTAGGGMMRFAGTLSKPGSVVIGGNPAVTHSDNSFEGYAMVAGTGTTQVPLVVTDGDGIVTSKYANITPASVSNQAFHYDFNGNTSDSGPNGAPTSTYGWDAADRLTNVTQGSTVMSYDYDGLGRRLREWNSTDGGTTRTETRHWVWCGLELCEERAPNNSVIKRFYGQGEQISGTGYYFTRDHLGSVREMLDATGVVATGGLHARYDYELYGQRDANSVTVSPVASDFGFTGYEDFSTLGLAAAPLRFYQPAFGRWLSRDPIAESGGINLYGYVGNNPVSETDPLGLSPADVARLQTVSSGLIYQMTVDGQRLASWIWGPAGGYLGNIIQTPQDLFDAATGRPLRNYQQGSWSCQSQAQNIQDRLEPFLQPGWLDDTWTATQVQNDSNTHVWIQLNSSNPGDPVIVVDPFKGRVNAK